MKTGIALLLAAMLLTPGVDAVAKTLSGQQTPMMIAFLRYFTAGLVALAVAAAGGRRIVVPRGDRLGQFWRTGLIMGAMTAMIAALGRAPMATAVGGFLTAPIVSGLLGVLVWGEPATRRRLLGAAASCAGAAVLMRPEAGLNVGCGLALLGGVLLGTYLAATRGAGARTDPLSTLAVQSLLGAALILPFALAGGVPAPSTGLMLGALALGGLSAACHFLTVAAYHRAEAGVLAPFLYFNLITAAAMGFAVFGEVPDGPAILGLLAITIGGVLSVGHPLKRFKSVRIA